MIRSRVRLLAAVVLLTALGAGAHQAYAAGALTITVNTTLDGDDPTPGDALCDTLLASPAAGKCSLRAAVETASNQPLNASTTINVPAASQHYLLTPALGQITLDRDAPGTVTISGAQRAGVVIDGGGAAGLTDFQVFGDVVMRNLTITGGNNTNFGGVGGLNYLGGALTMSNIRITGNQGFQAGGISQSGLGTLTITNAEIDHNASLQTGCGFSCFATDAGGLNLSGGPVTLSYDVIANNSTTGFGGGLFINTAPGNVVSGTNLVIAANSAGLNGGGMDAESSYDTSPQVVLSNSVVENNSAQTSGSFVNPSGGGIYNDTFMQITATRVIYNAAGTQGSGLGLGGGIDNDTDGMLKMSGGSITGNSAGNFGGGLYNYFIATLNSVPVTGNQAGIKPYVGTPGAGQGGGIYTSVFSTLHVEGGSVSSNSAGVYGGGIISRTNDLEVDGAAITGNVAGGTSGCSGFGGGIYVDQSGDVPPTHTLPNPGIHGGSISSNSAQEPTAAGGTCPDHPDSPCLASGGGIFMTTSTLAVNGNAHVDSNHACSGGGIYVGNFSTLTFTGVISLNAAIAQGGAMFVAPLGTAAITGSRIAGNRAAQTGGIYNLGPVTISTSLISGNMGSSTCLNVLSPCL
jgi:CSLREA domain-containing protein